MLWECLAKGDSVLVALNVVRRVWSDGVFCVESELAKDLLLVRVISDCKRNPFLEAVLLNGIFDKKRDRNGMLVI